MTETVTRLRADVVGTDRRGNAELDWHAVDRLEVDGCVVAPRTEGEITDGGRQGVVIGWTVYAPAGVDVIATDRVEVRGEAFDVDGDPAAWRNPYTASEPGVVIELRTVKG